VFNSNISQAAAVLLALLSRLFPHCAGDTYYATPSYPNTKPDENASDNAAAAAMAASRSPHPSCAADTSSMNDPAGAPQPVSQ
jgi:hypothetical protein